MNHRLAQLNVKLHVLLMLQEFQFTICAIAVVHSNVPIPPIETIVKNKEIE